MARRQTNTPPQSANLSVEQMKFALPRLENRIAELCAFNPDEITGRDDPKIKVLEDAIDDFLTRTFGEGTVEYKRYSPARNLVTGGILFGHTTPLNEVISGLQRGKDRAIGDLEGIKRLFSEEIDLAGPAPSGQVQKNVQPNPISREVFIVHGSDHGTRETVARFLEKLDLLPVILDEAANKGRTIHQKFRDHSTVTYAVALFTPMTKGTCG